MASQDHNGRGYVPHQNKFDKNRGFIPGTEPVHTTPKSGASFPKVEDAKNQDTHFQPTVNIQSPMEDQAPAQPISSDSTGKASSFQSSTASWLLITAISAILLGAGLLYLISTQPPGMSLGFEIELSALMLIFAAQAYALKVNLNRTHQLFHLFPAKFGVLIKERKERNARYILTSVDVSYSYAVIISRLNNYLDKNAGASNDYGILKQIIELELKSVSNKAAGFLSFPLFLGLAGTFLGVVFGLAGFATESASMISATSATASADAGASAVSQLLGGVSIAMVGSLFGLSFTLISQQQYTIAKEHAASKFNECLSFVQAELLPETQKDADQAYRTLAANLENFNNKLEINLSALDKNFLAAIKEAKDSTKRELEILESIKHIGITEVVTGNAKLVEKLVPLLKAFELVLGRMSHLDEAAVSTTRMLQSFNQFYTSQTDQKDILAGLSHFVTDQGLIGKQLVDLLSGNNDRVTMLLDRLERNIAVADDNFQTELERRRIVLSKLLDSTNVQVAEFLNLGETKDIFKELKTLPSNIKDLVGVTNQYGQQLSSLPGYLTRVEAAVTAIKQEDVKSASRLVSALSRLEDSMAQNNLLMQKSIDEQNQTILSKFFGIGGKKPSNDNNKEEPTK